jgi:hypothetical protein
MLAALHALVLVVVDELAGKRLVVYLDSGRFGRTSYAWWQQASMKTRLHAVALRFKLVDVVVTPFPKHVTIEIRPVN